MRIGTQSPNRPSFFSLFSFGGGLDFPEKTGKMKENQQMNSRSERKKNENRTSRSRRPNGAASRCL
ncbi:MAG: hypothetical protein J6A23_03050, partial [Thermoguttaceae bacterium]|nr:hypothetical protein [Thermoguttaceae bacterium]